MIGIQNYLISDSVLTTRFACDLSKCKGACCVEGLAGPPVTREEIDEIEALMPVLRPSLRPEGLAVIDQKGIWEEWEGTPVLTCVNEKECVFVVFRDGIAKCAIEEHWQKNPTAFRKPVSCHLFPIRVRDFFGQKALNVVDNDDCKPAIVRGKRESVPVHRFLQDAIIRRFGSDFYQILDHEYTRMTEAAARRKARKGKIR